MRTCNRVALVAAAGVFAVAVPAAAKPPHPGHPTHPAHPTHPSTSHKCVPRNEAYIASGALVSWSATKNANGTYTGTVRVHVSKANHHASATKGNDVTYTLSGAKAAFGSGANPPMAGDPVKVIGRISVLAKKCSQTGFASKVTARKIAVHAAKK